MVNEKGISVGAVSGSEGGSRGRGACAASAVTAMVMLSVVAAPLAILLGSPLSSAAAAKRPSSRPPIDDLLSQQGPKLVGSGSVRAAFEGAVAVSADGSTALIGGSGDNGNTGAAWVFTRTNATWRQQAKLVGRGASSLDNQGASVALSANGNTALVGAPGNRVDVGARSVEIGAVWVFTRANGTWRQQAKLVATDAIGDAEQGFSVALSADGSEALIGGPGDHGNTGAAWVFTRAGGTWRLREKLVGSSAVGEAGQGITDALSSDGRTALVGGIYDNSNVGAAWVFTRAHGAWGRQGAKLTVSDASGSPFFGLGVALSADGSTALIGGPGDNGETGAGWVFTRADRVWSEQAKLVGSGAVGFAQQGMGVAVSGDGNTALIGGPYDNGRLGATWEFERTGGVWSQQGPKLVGTGVQDPFTREPGQGASVAMSSSGTTALVGDPQDNRATGAVWVFATPGAVSPPSNMFTVSHIRTVADGTLRFRVDVPGPGRIDLLETAWKDNLASAAMLLQPASGRFVFARAHRTATHSGAFTLRIAPDARGKLLVTHHAYRVTLRLWVSYTPTGGTHRSIGFYGLHLPRTCVDPDQDHDCDTGGGP